MVDEKPGLLYVVTLAEVGGAQSYVRDLMTAAREEFSVTVAAFGEGPLRTTAEELGIPFVPLRHVRRPLSPLQDLLGLVELTRLFRRLRPQVVHLNSSKAGVLGRVAARLAGVPACVFTAHGWAFKASSGLSSRLYLWADRAVRPLTSMVICVSAEELRAGIAAGACVPARTRVILNAVEVGEAPALRTGVGEGPMEIVSVGRLAEPKDFATLVAALAQLPTGRARLRILGEGPLRAAIEGQVAALGLGAAVELTGEVGDVRAFLQMADLFVLASRSEGMPISVLEAMAAGLPVVASDVGGLGEVVVDGETGYLVPAGDADELARRLGELSEDAALRGRLGLAGYERAAERFSLPRWRDEHFQLYRALLAVKPGTPAERSGLDPGEAPQGSG